MKILIDLTSLADNFSGIERYAACIALEMVEYSDTDFILLFKENVFPMFKEVVKKTNVTYRVIKKCNKLLFNQCRLPNAVRRETADWYLFLAFPVPILLFKKNMISTIHDICCWDCPDTMTNLSKWYFRISHLFALKKCKKIITISDFSKKRILERLKCKEEKLWRIYCGVDKTMIMDKMNNLDRKRIAKKYKLPKKYILSLSTLEPRKNLGLLICAYQKLVKKGQVDIPLVLAGRKGWKINSLLKNIDEQTKKSIVFTGFIDSGDLAGIYGMANIFVFPSKYEGFGLPPLEAMACNTVVVASNISSLLEILGEAAIYFKSGDLISLSNVLERTLHLSDNEINKRVELGRRQVNKFSWKDESSKLIELLKSC